MHRRKKPKSTVKSDCATYIWKEKQVEKKTGRFNRKRRMDLVNAPAYVAICRLNLVRLQAAPIDRLAWKHSRQNTGRPCVGRKGTVVSLPHCEHVVFVSARIWVAFPPPPPPPSARLALQPLQRLGSFLKPLSAKNICSPAVKTNSAPHSEHFNTLSWNSMSAPPENPVGHGERVDLPPWALE
jgi:hypothetical protein